MINNDPRLSVVDDESGVRNLAADSLPLRSAFADASRSGTEALRCAATKQLLSELPVLLVPGERCDTLQRGLANELFSAVR